ncbi:MAG: sulfotransferase [Verrucomicrobiota bacterium]|nr:sulfotransferase [Verrucomicrobiota bacterium]
MPKRKFPDLLHPIGGCGFIQFWKLYFNNWPYTLYSLPSRLFSLMAVTFRVPAVFFEKIRHKNAINLQEIKDGPIFIVGHWRSGTTHLHNLLSQDNQFAFITFSRSLMPLDCLGKLRPARALMKIMMPKNRGMDKVAIGPDTPQEEEFALAALGSVSFLKCLYFPRRIEKYFSSSVFLKCMSDQEKKSLKSAYLYLTKKMTYAHNGKTMLYKNPACTSRMSLLKEIFPNAKFIHIVRDPFEVFPSMMKLWNRMTPSFSWHRNASINYEEITYSFYERIMKAHLKERQNIPSQDYHEVRYEDLDSDPLTVVNDIYQGLGIKVKKESVIKIERYIEDQKKYQKNTHQLSDNIKKRLMKQWSFAFDHWNYTYPDN